MKKLIFIMVAVATLASCKKENDGGRWRDDTPIYINGVDKANKSLQQILTAHEICQLDSIYMDMRGTDEDGYIVSSYKLFTKAEKNIDAVNNRLIMEAINLETLHDNQFLTFGAMCLICNLDTVAYVPLEQRLEAKDKIAEYWGSDNWDAMYNIFQNTFTFIPCTGAEFKKMQSEGKEDWHVHH